MPKAILEFNLPEENNEHHTTINAGNYFSSIWDIYSYLRSRRKYEELSEEKAATLEEVWEKFWEILRDNGVEDDF